MYITRQHVIEVLTRAGLSPEDEKIILDRPYPVELDEMTDLFLSMGVTRDWLISRLGGSP